MIKYPCRPKYYIPYMTVIKSTNLNFWAKTRLLRLAPYMAIVLLQITSPLFFNNVSWARTVTDDKIEKLIRDLKTNDFLTNSNISVELGNLGEAAVPRLIIALRDKDPRVRSGASLALGLIGGQSAKKGLHQLIDNLEYPDARVRSSAARAIGSIVAERNLEAFTGNEVIDAINFAPKLIHALSDQELSVRINASSALIMINNKASLITANLISNLDPSNIDVSQRSLAIVALRKIRYRANSVVPKITSFLSSQDPSVRSLAISTLGSIGADAKLTLPHIVKALKDPDSSVRSNASRVLVKVATSIQEKARVNYLFSSDVNAIAQLEQGLNILLNSDNHFYNNEKESVRLAINALRIKKRFG